MRARPEPAADPRCLSRSVAETSAHPCASPVVNLTPKPGKEAVMLQRTEENGIIRTLKTFNPEVSGWVFWPVIFGVAVILQLMVITIR